jgi:hypothetical protein
MNKKNEKTEKKIETKEVKKVEVKKTTSFKKKKKIKKILLQVLHMFTQLLIIQLYQLLMRVEMLFHGHQLVQKVLKDQESQHHTQHRLQLTTQAQKLLSKD